MKLLMKTRKNFYRFYTEFLNKNQFQINKRAIEIRKNVKVQMTSMKLVSLTLKNQDFTNKLFGNISKLENPQLSNKLSAEELTNL